MTGHAAHRAGFAGPEARSTSGAAIGEVTLVGGQGRRLPGSGAAVLRHLSRTGNDRGVTSAWPR
jgi:hypothetical protein